MFQRAYRTEALNAGQPKEVTADRVDMTHEIMDKHYDKATKNEQMGDGRINFQTYNQYSN